MWLIVGLHSAPSMVLGRQESMVVGCRCVWQRVHMCEPTLLYMYGVSISAFEHGCIPGVCGQYHVGVQWLSVLHE